MRNTRWVQGAVAALGIALLAGADECNPAPLCLRYDQVQQIMLHNAYGETDPLNWVDEPLLDLIVTHRVRALELDLQPSLPCGPDAEVPVDPDWYIYHDGTGNDHSTVKTLRDALRLIAAWSRAQPDHEVLTLNMELGSWADGKCLRSEFTTYAPYQLDGLFREELGDLLYTPQLLLDRNHQPTLSAAVNPANGGWPLVDELRGKVIVVFNGTDNDLNLFFNGRYDDKVGFRVDGGAWASTDPNYAASQTHLVYHRDVHLVPGIDGAVLHQRLPGHIYQSKQIDDCNGQVCGLPYDHDRFDEYQAMGVNFLFMNRRSQSDAHYRVTNDFRYPFAAADQQPDGTFAVGDAAWLKVSIVGKVEPGDDFQLSDTTGGDLDGSSDRFTYALDALGTGSSEVLTTMISTVSNKYDVHPHGKGFLMARASLDPDAAYCAVGKTGNLYGPRAQWRSGPGLGTAWVESYGSLGTWGGDNRRDRENASFVRLEVTTVPAGVSCRAYTSMSGLDGEWDLIADQTLPVASLPLIGFAAANNQGYDTNTAWDISAETPNPFTFVGTTRIRDGQEVPIDATTLQPLVNVGGANGWLIAPPPGPESPVCAP